MKPKRKSKKNLTNASVVLDSILSRRNLKNKIGEYKSLEVWDDVVGETIALNAQPVSIKKGCLKVVAANHGWLQQLQFLKEDIRKKLNRELKKETIKEMYFVVGEIAEKHEKPGRFSDKMKKITISDDERRSISDMLQGVEDKELRSAIRKILIKKAKRDKLEEDG